AYGNGIDADGYHKKRRLYFQQCTEGASAETHSRVAESRPRPARRRLSRVPVQSSDRQRGLVRKRIPERDTDKVEICSGTEHRLYLLYYRRGARLDRQPDGNSPFYGAALPRSVSGRTTEKPVCACVWILRGVHPVLSLHD